MDSRYSSDPLLKRKQNESLVRYVRSVFGNEIKHVRALIIDTHEGNTTNALWSIGIRNITVINYDENELIPLEERYIGIKTFAGSFEDFCSEASEIFDFIYYDSCNTLNTSYKSFYSIFEKGLLNQKKNIFAVSLSSRQRIVCDPDRLKKPYKINHWWSYMKSDNYAVYFADQLIKDYAHRFKYLIQRKPRRAQYKTTMFQLVYYCY